MELREVILVGYYEGIVGTPKNLVLGTDEYVGYAAFLKASRDSPQTAFRAYTSKELRWPGVQKQA